MLFDLRGRGRRRTVRVIYVGLALLMGVGLVGFGIGGGLGGGGLLSAIGKGEGSGSTSFAGQIAKYSKLTQQQPKNVSAWEGLTKNLLHEAGSEAYVTASGAVTSKGRELFNQTARAWSGYIALNPSKPNLELAKEMLRVFDEEGLNQPASVVEVLQIVVAAEPTNVAYYARLAEYAYKAHNVRVGDLASKRAVSLAPAAQRARLKAELAEVEANPSGEKTYTTTTNGKTYAGTMNAKGEFKGTEVKTTPAPAGKSSTTKKK